VSLIEVHESTGQESLENAWPPSIRYKKERPLDRALIVIHASKALFLDHIGPGIDYYLSNSSFSEDEWTEQNGVYVWEGKFVWTVITYLEGDKDVEEELVTLTMRLATLEEWTAHLKDEYIWDRDEWLLPLEKQEHVIAQGVSKEG